MNAELQIRAMKPGDLLFADSLRAQTGWNQTLSDWQRFLEMQPDGCFLAEWNGAPAGTAVTTIYGPELAWIGMVLVHPQFRRRGIGRNLLLWCIRHLQGCGARCIKLDATPEGRLVYQNLGFKDEWTLRRWEADVSNLPREHDSSQIRHLADADLPGIEALDVRAFGVSRRDLLRSLARHSSCALVYEPESGAPAGFGMLRHGSRASCLGPISARSSQAGIALIEALLSHIAVGRVFWDIPDSNALAVAWGQRNGFSVQRILTRMWLGENCAPSDAHFQFAVAGPEVG